MTDNLPLAGLNIVVTRPREQAAPLVRSIAELGGNCIQFPLLEITPLTDERPLRDLAARLHQFQLAIFISPNAVRYGMPAIQHAGGLPASLQVATVGLSSAKALHDYGVKKVIAPQLRFDSESLLALPELQEVAAKNIVIFRGDSGRELLGDTLKSRGANVEYVTCYHRSKPQHDVTALFAARPDVLCVSSSEALHNLWELLNPVCRLRFTALPLFVSHERIAQAARKLGWQQIVSTTAEDEGLLSELIGWAALKRGQK
ncbi:MAG TPA: uroporphyrinogen-III synthase [Gallionellaceae bacterium]|nr:uroporphyrinogen-III synthase [Gallionellaceae bacterium]